MASKLKNRQKVAEIEKALAENETKAATPTSAERRGSRVNSEGEPFQDTPNIAARIALRRLPRRTPTSHVKGAIPDAIRRRLSKMSSTEKAHSHQDSSFDDSDAKSPSMSRQATLDDSGPPEDPSAPSTSSKQSAN